MFGEESKRERKVGGGWRGKGAAEQRGVGVIMRPATNLTGSEGCACNTSESITVEI